MWIQYLHLLHSHITYHLNFTEWLQQVLACLLRLLESFQNKSEIHKSTRTMPYISLLKKYERFNKLSKDFSHRKQSFKNVFLKDSYVYMRCVNTFLHIRLSLTLISNYKLELTQGITTKTTRTKVQQYIVIVR